MIPKGMTSTGRNSHVHQSMLLTVPHSGSGQPWKLLVLAAVQPASVSMTHTM